MIGTRRVDAVDGRSHAQASRQFLQARLRVHGGPVAVRICQQWLDKTLYEAVYESRNRPDWLPIPMAGLERLLG